jgi:hypothetical protein
VAGRVERYDHIVLGRSGIHVIDALNLPGKIKGNRVQAWWQRRSWGHSYPLANPVHENFLRLQALQQALGLPLSKFHPWVALSGHSSLTTDATDVVMDVLLAVKKINSENRQLLGGDELSAALLRIQELKLHAPILSKQRSWLAVQLLCGLGFVGGTWMIYQDEIMRLYTTAFESALPPATPLTDVERWESSLICSYSVDTQRCACYERRGEKVQLSADRCRELAQRGSVIQQ